MNLKHPTKTDLELVLEDGRFARIKRPTRLDFIKAWARSSGDLNMLLAHLVVSLTTIDEQPISLEDWLEADFEFTVPIANAVDRIFKDSASGQNRNGVA